MPALLLHLTLVEEAARAATDGPLAQAARHTAPLLLGSIWPDLPYHARFLRQTGRHVLRRSYLKSEWGDVLHTRGTGRLALALIAHAARARLAGQELDEVLALIAGYLCHCAADTAVHPAINRLVDRRRRDGDRRPTDVIHAQIDIDSHEPAAFDASTEASVQKVADALVPIYEAENSDRG